MRAGAVVTVHASIGVGGVPEPRQLVGGEEGAGVPLHRAGLGVAIPTSLRLTGRGVRQGNLHQSHARDQQGLMTCANKPQHGRS